MRQIFKFLFFLYIINVDPLQLCTDCVQARSQCLFFFFLNSKMYLVCFLMFDPTASLSTLEMYKRKCCVSELCEDGGMAQEKSVRLK